MLRTRRLVRRPGLLWGVLALLLTVGAILGWRWYRTEREVIAVRAELTSGDLAAALARLTSPTANSTESAEWQYLLAVTLRRLGELGRCEIPLRRAEALGWPADDIQRQRWLAQVQSGDVAAAEEPLMKAAQSGASDEATNEIYEAVAQGHLHAARWSEAALCLQMWLAWNPEAPRALVMRGRLHEEQGDDAAAIDDYAAAVRMLPALDEARGLWARALARQEQWEPARREYHAVLARRPDSVEARIGLARCERALGQIREARNRLAPLRERELSSSDRAALLLELGQIYLEEGKVRHATLALEQSLRFQPAKEATHQALARALLAAGRPEEAKRHAAVAQEILVRDDRLRAIRRRLQHWPADADLRCEAGLLLFQQGLYEEGAHWLDTALACDPRHRPSHRALAEFYAETGDQSRAAHHRILAAAPWPTPNP